MALRFACVDRNGPLSDVAFLDGNCLTLYGGCDEASDFTFQTQAAAELASQALIDAVFVNDVAGAFDDNPALTNGFNSSIRCSAVKPCRIGAPVSGRA